MEKEKSPKKKKLITNLIRIALLLLIFFGALIYPCYHFMKQTYKDWDTFDDKRIAEVEKRLDMTIPAGAEPLKFNWSTGAGDVQARLIVGGISDPEEFMEKAFPKIEVKELSADENLADVLDTLNESTPENEKSGELLKVPTDNKSFGSIKSELEESASKLGYSIDLTEVYDRFYPDRIRGQYYYYIGFGKADDGYYAKILYYTL
ncbi:MAG: hypothetical protein J5582_03125 [Ruminococcus sp.]|uniref:hypothetical protein n=1 Tax=Ruminococcus sp. TaxID=41978 RepID=UPI0025D43EA4|nr:hypothetical protein [Ruminococcus sp.]MBO4865552.1 hypothetical protein [Ruminococcus sp.]